MSTYCVRRNVARCLAIAVSQREGILGLLVFPI